MAGVGFHSLRGYFLYSGGSCMFDSDVPCQWPLNKEGIF